MIILFIIVELNLPKVIKYTSYKCHISLKSTLESTSYIAKISRTTHIIQNMLFAKMDNSLFYISYEGSMCPWNAANIICM